MTDTYTPTMKNIEDCYVCSGENYDGSVPGKRLSPEFRADLVEAARERIQAVWADVPEGVDAKTLAQNVVSAQEFFWLSLHFPVLPSSTVDEGKIAEVVRGLEFNDAGCWGGGIDCTESVSDHAEEIARAVVEAIGGESR